MTDREIIDPKLYTLDHNNKNVIYIDCENIDKVFGRNGYPEYPKFVGLDDLKGVKDE